MENQTQTINTVPVIAPAPKKSNKTLIVCCSIVAILLLCLATCAGIFFLVFKTGMDVISNETSKIVCAASASDADIARLYNDATTSSFRERVTQAEFALRVKQLPTNYCETFKDMGFTGLIDLMSNGWDFNSTTVNGRTAFYFRTDIGGKRIYIELVDSGNGQSYQVNDLTVTPQ